MQTNLNIYFHVISGEISLSDIVDISTQLPDDMQTRASKYHSDLAAIQFIIGRLLLRHGLQKINSKDELQDLCYTDQNKPLLPHTKFNISHSQHLVICAFSSLGDVGVDVEVPTSININNLRHSFTHNEWIHIQQDPSLMYPLWCRKEAVIKATPFTLKDLHRIEVSCLQSIISIQKKTYHLRDLSFVKAFEAFGAVCTEFPVSEVIIEPFF